MALRIRLLFAVTLACGLTSNTAAAGENLALGAKVDVPTLREGEVTVTIPPGTSSGAKLRIRGQGFVDRKTKQPGDQLVVVKITIPGQLSDRATKLLEELREISPENPRAGLW